MELELSDRKIEVPETLLDLPLKKYLDVAKIIDKMPKTEAETGKFLSTIEGELLYFDLIEAIIDGYDTILIEDIEKVNEYIAKIISNSSFPTEVKRVIEIDGTKYITRDLSGMNSLETGEYISIKVYQERFAHDYYKYAQYVLAILIRPGTEEFDAERNETIYTQGRFDKKDIANLEFRAERFLNARAGDLIPVLNFFLNTKKEI